MKFPSILYQLSESLIQNEKSSNPLSLFYSWILDITNSRVVIY